MPATQLDFYTPEQYLALEATALERSEYIDGEIIPMVGALPNHNLIIGNFYAALNFALKRKPYYVFVTDQRLWIPSLRIYTYPDIMVVSGDLILQAGRKDTITNPMLIVEVLSQSTQSYDQGKKFKAYRSIPSFQEYVLIDQSDMHIEVYSRQDNGQWLLSEWNGNDAILQLSKIDFEIALADVYDKVNFEE
ncbi:Uma2 family endonuclease [Synechocystis sp. B12]|jgi:Uma2 family endonuclease|uniref:Uma2 family endonuclease n=1 Tax=Synechocystis sp. CACIAM 05 TaxID=1933929 RepID=UPI00138E6BE6|nr:Uma2 family endonuclease [Synechocystis sp. CACIAM 05]QHV01154.1 hypothetical protein BWK47_14105 [Synechocystis sp. CACIAM 05]WLT39139.1 Uma2 family endonuclease [Synechocystis sp. B12]